MTEAKSQSESQIAPGGGGRLATYLGALSLMLTAMRAARRTQAAKTIHGKQSQSAITLVNILVYKATVSALRGIPLVQDERELPVHAAGST